MDRTEKIVLILFALLLLGAFFGGSIIAPSEEVAPEPTTIPTLTPNPTTTPTPEPTPTPTPEIKYYTEDEVIMVAKVLYDECRGIASDTEKACVAWTICNRVDAGYASTISGVIKSPNQFAYRSSAPVWDELYALAQDVLTRWNHEKNGMLNVGRVLPSDYLWYSGDGYHNWFRNHYKAAYGYWDYSIESPYES